MIKHLFGFALFSSIVGTAIFVSWIFSSPRARVPAVETVSYDSYKNSCWKMKPKKSFERSGLMTTLRPSIRQAVLNLNSKQMEWDLVVPENRTDVALHFFVKDSRGTRYLNSELVPAYALSRVSHDDDGGTLEFTSSYQWLDNLSSYQNLYIVPEFVSQRGIPLKDLKPEFDEASAIPVLLDWSKPVSGR